jgi:hypothetical protein
MRIERAVPAYEVDNITRVYNEVKEILKRYSKDNYSILLDEFYDIAIDLTLESYRRQVKNTRVEERLYPFFADKELLDAEFGDVARIYVCMFDIVKFLNRSTVEIDERVYIVSVRPTKIILGVKKKDER